MSQLKKERSQWSLVTLYLQQKCLHYLEEPHGECYWGMGFCFKVCAAGTAPEPQFPGRWSPGATPGSLPGAGCGLVTYSVAFFTAAG